MLKELKVRRRREQKAKKVAQDTEEVHAKQQSKKIDDEDLDIKDEAIDKIEQRLQEP